MTCALPREQLPKVSGRVAVQAERQEYWEQGYCWEQRPSPQALARCFCHIWGTLHQAMLGSCQHSQMLPGLGSSWAGRLRGPQPLAGLNNVSAVGGGQEWAPP